MFSRGLILIDHGSRRADANQALEAVAELVRAKLGDGTFVTIAHMELAEPTLEQAMRACVDAGVTEVRVHPYMLVPGRHAKEDIPAMAKVAAAPYPHIKFAVSEPLGIHPRIAEVVIERVGWSESDQES